MVNMECFSQGRAQRTNLLPLLVLLLGILTLSPLPWEPLVLQQCLWLQGAWSALGYFPGKVEGVVSTIPLAHLAYLLDLFWIGWLWVSPLVLLDLSLKYRGMLSGCLEPAFHTKGSFGVPLTPAGLQDSGQGVVPIKTQVIELCVYFSHLFAFAHPIPCLERPCFFSPY